MRLVARKRALTKTELVGVRLRATDRGQVRSYKRLGLVAADLAATQPNT